MVRSPDNDETPHAPIAYPGGSVGGVPCFNATNRECIKQRATTGYCLNCGDEVEAEDQRCPWGGTCEVSWHPVETR